MGVDRPPLPSGAVIREAPDEVLERLVIDAVDQQLKISQGGLYETVTTLPVGYQAVYATWILEAEVANGGFLQYFYNPGGQLAGEACDGLERMGASAHAAVLEDAMERVLSEAETLAPLWQPRTLDGFFASYRVSQLPELDRKWYALRDIKEQRTRYIRMHPEDFEAVAR